MKLIMLILKMMKSILLNKIINNITINRKIKKFWKDIDYHYFKIPNETQINYLEFKEYPINNIIFNMEKSLESKFFN